MEFQKEGINMIFRKCENPICYYCIYSKPISGTEDMLCEKKGVVSETFTCKKFAYDVRKRKVQRRSAVAGSFKPEDFAL